MQLKTGLRTKAKPGRWKQQRLEMSCSLNSLKRVIYGGLYRGVSGLIKGDTRSLDYSSNASSC